MNGADYRRGTFKDDFADRVNAINRNRPGARISLKLAIGPAGELSVQGTVAVAEAGWKPADLRVASFVQNEHTGDVLQALALPACR